MSRATSANHGHGLAMRDDAVRANVRGGSLHHRLEARVGDNLFEPVFRQWKNTKRIADHGVCSTGVSRGQTFEKLWMPADPPSWSVPRGYLARIPKSRREARDARVNNANARRLNKESLDVLEYQGLPCSAATSTWSKSRGLPARDDSESLSL